MRMRHVLVAVLSVLALALGGFALVGCGGDDSADESSAPAASETQEAAASEEPAAAEDPAPAEEPAEASSDETAEFVAEVCAIVVPANERIDALDEQSAEGLTPQEVGAGIREQAEVVGGLIEDLQGLSPPEELREAWDRSLELQAQLRDWSGDLAEAMEAGDPEAAEGLLERLESLEPVNEELNQLNAELGTADCADREFD